MSSKLWPFWLALFCLGPCNPALASVDLPDSRRSTAVAFDRTHFAASSCVYSLDGTTEASCANAGDQRAVLAFNRGSPIIEIGSQTGGSHALSCPECENATAPDSMATFASRPSSRDTGPSNAISGGLSLPRLESPAAVHLSDSTEITFGARPTTPPIFTDFLTSASGSTAVDLRLGLLGDPAERIRFRTETRHFLPAPEPASVALIGTGLVGLMLARPRRIRSRPERNPDGTS